MINDSRISSVHQDKAGPDTHYCLLALEYGLRSATCFQLSTPTLKQKDESTTYLLH